MKLIDIDLKIILDSRRKETISADLYGLVHGFTRIEATASVPSGKSKGVHEAFVLEPKKALEKFEEIKPQILAASASGRIETQEEFDNFLISLDRTPNKENLGANLILALSLAWARLKAKSENIELYEYITKNLNPKPKTQNPKPIFNVINGGAHSGYPHPSTISFASGEWRAGKSALNQRQLVSLDFQEFQVIPQIQDFGLAFGLGEEFYHKLKEFLEKKFGKENTSLGDEAGFSCPFKNNEEAIEILAELISKYSYPLRIGLDAAATQFYKQQATSDKGQEAYLIDNKEYSAEELKNFYLKLIEVYNISSIEDPFYEEDFDDFAKLTQNLMQNRCGTLIIADDLTSTNPQRLQIAINKKAGNAILIKPNQIGTLTETLKVVQIACENNWQTIVSHRSGETMDDFIADLAVGINAWGIKAGAPAAPERLIKYKRVLEIQRF